MAITKTFTTVSPTVLTVDSLDFAGGLGYKRVFGVGTATDEFLTSNTIDSDVDNTSTSFTAADDVIALLGEVNFDLKFTRRIVLEGEAFLQMTGEVTTGASTNGVIQLKFRLIHVDTAASETELTSQIATVQKTTSQATNTSYRFMNSVAFPKQIFLVNELLRLEVAIHGRKNGSAGTTIELWHDGSNRANAVSGDATNLILDTPLRKPR